eukprot:gene19336-4762_t
MLDDPPRPPLGAWLVGKGDWVSDHASGAHGLWFERWGAVFKPMGPGRPV